MICICNIRSDPFPALNYSLSHSEHTGCQNNPLLFDGVSTGTPEPILNALSKKTTAFNNYSLSADLGYVLICSYLNHRCFKQSPKPIKYMYISSATKQIVYSSQWSSGRYLLVLFKSNIIVLTFPVMTIQPSWSMMSTSSGDGGWQNFCWRICRMYSMTLGVSLRATAMWPSPRMVWSGMRWASLANIQVVFLEELLIGV